MNNFLYTVAISYLPLHEKAVETAKEVGIVEVKRDKKKSSFLNAYESIQKEMDRGSLVSNANMLDVKISFTSGVLIQKGLTPFLLALNKN